VNFVVKEHPSFSLGANMGVTTTADADLTCNAMKKAWQAVMHGSYLKIIKVRISRTFRGEENP